MEDIELVIKMPERIYNHIMSMQFYIPGSRNGKSLLEEILKAIRTGTPLSKGHGRLIDEIEILKFLKCPKYENCNWKNCFDCNESRCINLNNISSLVSIIGADK